MPSNILDEILKYKRVEITTRKLSHPLKMEALAPASGKFLKALRVSGRKIIAEIKPKSPSNGILRKDLDIVAVVKAYDRFACAISVLTDKKYFDGSIELLAQIAKISSLPILCKEFIIDAYQCYEARQAGAEAILLIVKALNDQELFDLYLVINKLNMTPVVEIQNEQELERALKLDPSVIMVNNRNLQTLELDLSTSKRLIPKIPKEIVTISASGIQFKSDMKELGSYCQNFLVGSSLMQSENIEKTLSDLIEAQREA